MTETDASTRGDDEEQGGGVATAAAGHESEVDMSGDEMSEEEMSEEEMSEEEMSEEAPQGETDRPRHRPSVKRLEEEGEVAADYLEELLDIADLDGDIDIDVENGRASVAILTEGGPDRQLRHLAGAHGEVLEALQELARLAVQARTGERSRLMLDVAGYRAGRRRILEDVAARAVAEVRRTGDAVRLDPMNAFERKVIHDVVAEAGLASESEGVEPARRVVVQPVA